MKSDSTSSFRRIYPYGSSQRTIIRRRRVEFICSRSWKVPVNVRYPRWKGRALVSKWRWRTMDPQLQTGDHLSHAEFHAQYASSTENLRGIKLCLGTVQKQLWQMPHQLRKYACTYIKNCVTISICASIWIQSITIIYRLMFLVTVKRLTTLSVKDVTVLKCYAARIWCLVLVATAIS